MIRVKTIFIIFFLACLTGPSNGQDRLMDYSLLLRTGTLSLPQNSRSYLPAEDFERKELIGGKYYRILQFNEIPSPQERAKIAAAGLELLDYLPHYAYLTALPADLKPQQLEKLGVRSIVKLDWTNKIAPNLLEIWQAGEDLPTQLALRFPENIEPAVITHLLKNRRIEILTHFDDHHLLYFATESIDLAKLAALPMVQYIDALPEQVKPEDITGRNVHRANVLMANFQGGDYYDGAGVEVAVGDDGFVGPHIDFKGRTEQIKSNGTLQGNHGEIVAGILAGAGNLDPEKKGMAPGAFLHVFNGFEAITSRGSAPVFDDIVITSISYGEGCNRGYTTNTELADRQIRQSPNLIHVFSAGNSGEEDCNYGAGPGWGNITGGIKMGKNVMAIANLDFDFERVSNSSRGPASDGRIKPDISAIGTGQFSTAPGNEYIEASGTSVAAPGVAGILAQLYQAYRDLNEGLDPESALIKASVLNSARDLGPKGPDYSYGWGGIDANRALQVLKERRYFKGSVEQGESIEHRIELPEDAREFRAMLYWHDHEGPTYASRALVNDLDLTLIDKNQTLYLPWSPNAFPHPDSLNQPAQAKPDHLNNMEQVVLNNRRASTFSVFVNGYQVPKGPQDYYIVYEWSTDEIELTHPYGGEAFEPGTIERLHWDAYGTEEPFKIEFSAGNNLNWTLLAEVAGDQRTYDWTVPELAMASGHFRIRRNGYSDQTEASVFILKTPADLQVLKVCPDYIRLSWAGVPLAEKYIIYQLGTHFMDSLMEVTTDFVNIPNEDPSKEHWYAVKAVGEDGALSKRTIAVSSGVELKDCTVERDLGLTKINSPGSQNYQNCFDTGVPISINFKNEGSQMLQNFPVCYQLDEGNVVCELYIGAVPPGITVNYRFATDLASLALGNHQLKIWITLNEDEAHFNDTLQHNIRVYAGDAYTLPYFQTFDEFVACPSEDRCLNTCPLSESWINSSNILDDDIDWQVYNGPTPTFGTGPETDQNTRSEDGKYLYLEGSGGCFRQSSSLLSPCFDLRNESSPVLSFWYHMFGSDMGELQIDLFDGEQWHNNIHLPLVGDKGSRWQKAAVDLSTFSGKVIYIRFRGTTGQNYLTDIAIDNIGLFNAESPPVTTFTVDQVATCTGQLVQFSDNSFNQPTEWKWVFTPSNIEFLEGTSDESPNPKVLFNEEGIYSVELKTANSYGSNELASVTNFILVDNGRSLPIRENFEDIAEIDEGLLEVNNPDDDVSWELLDVIGANGEPTTAVAVNNHSYNAIEEEDEMVSLVIDLAEVSEPFLRFDYSYARYSREYTDKLEVWLAPDCGTDFTDVIFDKRDDALATVDNFVNGWTPVQKSDWRTVVIDLNAYKGSSVKVKFVNINGFGNSLYLDNILFYEKEQFPEARIGINSDSLICAEDEVVFINENSGGVNNSFNWSFGEKATPQSATGEGPHLVRYTNPGFQTVSLQVTNELGESEALIGLDVQSPVEVDYSYDIKGQTVHFFNETVGGESYEWIFGDGMTSTEKDPVHFFAQDTEYRVRLISSNACGTNEVEYNLKITTSTSAPVSEKKIDLFPNPASEAIYLKSTSSGFLEAEITLFNIHGQKLQAHHEILLSSQNAFRINVASYARGTYLLKIRHGEKTAVHRFTLL